MENWRAGDWDETQNGAHVMRTEGCAMQNQGIPLSFLLTTDPGEDRACTVTVTFLVAVSVLLS